MTTKIVITVMILVIITIIIIVIITSLGHHKAETTQMILYYSHIVIFCHQPMEAAFAQQWDSDAAVETEAAAVVAVAEHQRQLQEKLG